MTAGICEWFRGQDLPLVFRSSPWQQSGTQARRLCYHGLGDVGGAEAERKVAQKWFHSHHKDWRFLLQTFWAVWSSATLSQLRSCGFDTLFELLCSALEIGRADFNDEVLNAEAGR
jgi:hypothetical protein